MATKQDLKEWLVSALEAHNGSALIIDVCKHIWQSHRVELEESGSLFYTWQYDVRWQATQLRKEGVLRAATILPVGVWELAGR